jgi:hypothetical protein
MPILRTTVWRRRCSIIRMIRRRSSVVRMVRRWAARIWVIREVVLDSREAVEVLACLVVVVPVDLDVEVFGDLEADRGSRGDLERVLCDDLEQGLGSLDDLEVDCGSLDDLEVDHRGSQKVVHDYLGG